MAVTRETVLQFNSMIDPATVTALSVSAAFSGAPLTGRLHVSADQRTVTLFYDQTLPPSSTIRVSVDGSILRTSNGQLLDLDGDGTAGGLYQFDYQAPAPLPGLPILPTVGIRGSLQ